MNPEKTRRGFLKSAGMGVAALVAAKAGLAAPKNALPRWRGFNLLCFFQAREEKEGVIQIPEDDFRMIADLGFDFVRIPMDYWFWIESDWRTAGKPKPQDVLKIKASVLAGVDRIVELGKKHGLHVNLNFHRAPGPMRLSPHASGESNTE